MTGNIPNEIVLPLNDPETAPNGVAVLIAGGVAMKKTGGQWYTGMETPMFQRPLEWTPKWWAWIPNKTYEDWEVSK